MAYTEFVAKTGGELPRTAWLCLVAAEDHRSQSHLGVDFVELWRVIRQGIRTHRWRGASTIEMQLVRTLTARRERTVRRKSAEILLALRVREVIPKVDVPGVYLEMAHFGGESYGIKAICDTLRLQLSDLSLSQAAQAIARLRYPDIGDPSAKRQEQISTQVAYILRKVERCFPGEAE